jgi:hypothetical protein
MDRADVGLHGTCSADPVRAQHAVHSECRIGPYRGPVDKREVTA